MATKNVCFNRGGGQPERVDNCLEREKRYIVSEFLF